MTSNLKITARVFQTKTDAFFHLVEQAVFSGGTWTTYKDQHILEFVSGASRETGALRFVADNGESFMAVLGVFDNVPWCDVVSDLTNDQTSVKLAPEYYTFRHGTYTSSSVKDTKGRQVSINFTCAVGKDLACNIVIG